MTLSIEGFNRFVTFTVAPIATGWSESCRAGFAPARKPCIGTAHMKHLSLIVILAWLVSPRTLFGQNQARAPDVSSASSPSDSHAIKITRAGSQPSTDAPADHFTGSVKIELLFNDPSRAIGTSVTFEPGARTAWHTHPFGQTLFVTSGTRWIQQWGEPIVEIRKGDVIWIPAGTKHWHGATPTSSMTHVAITEQLDGNAVTWMEEVSEEQYHKQ